tara:strand:- start:961 stop:1215 length:255 start_codon:yes stop_codon:yes gene_type:complete
MDNYLNEIKKKISNKFDTDDITIIDNSQKHKNHKTFEKNKYHLELRIKSNYLNSLPRIDAQKKIFKLLQLDLEKKIHALQIKII